MISKSKNNIEKKKKLIQIDTTNIISLATLKENIEMLTNDFSSKKSQKQQNL